MSPAISCSSSARRAASPRDARHSFNLLCPSFFALKNNDEGERNPLGCLNRNHGHDLKSKEEDNEDAKVAPQMLGLVLKCCTVWKYPHCILSVSYPNANTTTGRTNTNIIGAFNVLFTHFGAEKRANLVWTDAGVITWTTRHNAGTGAEELKVLELVHHESTEAVVHRVDLRIQYNEFSSKSPIRHHKHHTDPEQAFDTEAKNAFNTDIKHPSSVFTPNGVTNDTNGDRL